MNEVKSLMDRDYIHFLSINNWFRLNIKFIYNKER